jgi:hypothetical protein
MERRRWYGEDEEDVLLDDLMATEQQYLDLTWPDVYLDNGRRKAS